MQENFLTNEKILLGDRRWLPLKPVLQILSQLA
jgi:hypothetical protein